MSSADGIVDLQGRMVDHSEKWQGQVRVVIEGMRVEWGPTLVITSPQIWVVTAERRKSLYEL